MEVYKLEVLIINYEEVGEEELKIIIEDGRYPNDCINPCITKIQSYDIGEWEDNHILNNVSLSSKEAKEYLEGKGNESQQSN